MFYRAVATAACVLVLAGCQQSGPTSDSSAGLTAPSSVSLKAVDVPFSGVVTGEAAFDFATNPKHCPLGFTTITTAAGTALHMGQVKWDSQHCLSDTSQMQDARLVLTAANGDEVYASYTGGCAFDGTKVLCSGDSQFTGGTGRFKDASGRAEWRAEVMFEGFEDFSWPGRWEWNGTIRY